MAGYITQELSKLRNHKQKQATSLSTTSVMYLADSKGNRTNCNKRGKCSSRVLGLYWIQAKSASNTDSSDPTCRTANKYHTPYSCQQLHFI